MTRKAADLSMAVENDLRVRTGYCTVVCGTRRSTLQGRRRQVPRVAQEPWPEDGEEMVLIEFFNDEAGWVAASSIKEWSCDSSGIGKFNQRWPWKQVKSCFSDQPTEQRMTEMLGRNRG